MIPLRYTEYTFRMINVFFTYTTAFCFVQLIYYLVTQFFQSSQYLQRANVVIVLYDSMTVYEINNRYLILLGGGDW